MKIIYITAFIIFICYLCILIYLGEGIPSKDNIDYNCDIQNQYSPYLFPGVILNFKNFLANQTLFYPSGLIEKLPIFYGDENSKKYFLYIHAFNSDSYEAKKLLFNLSSIYKDSFVCGINLPGAATIAKESSFTNINVHTHLRFFYILFSTIKDKDIYLIGSSTGCSYSIWINSKLKKIINLNIKCLIMFSPNIEPKGLSSFLTKLSINPFGLKIIKLLKYNYLLEETYSDVNMFSYLVGILEINRKDKEKYKSKVPLLTFYTSKDKIIDYKSIIDYVNKYEGYKILIEVDDDYHNMITRDYLLPFFIKNIKDFLKKI